MRPPTSRLLLGAALLLLLSSALVEGKGSSGRSSYSRSRSFSSRSTTRSSRSYVQYRSRSYGSRGSYYYGRSSYMGPHYYGYGYYGNHYSCMSCSRHTSDEAVGPQKLNVNIFEFKPIIRVNFDLSTDVAKTAFQRSLVETTYKSLGLSTYGIMQDDISVKILSPNTTVARSASAADRFAKCPTLSNYNWTNFKYANNGQCTVVSRRLKDIPNASCVQVQFVLFQVPSSGLSSTYNLKYSTAQKKLKDKLLKDEREVRDSNCMYYGRTSTLYSAVGYNQYHDLYSTAQLYLPPYYVPSKIGVREGWSMVTPSNCFPSNNNGYSWGPCVLLGQSNAANDLGVKFESKQLTSEYDAAQDSPSAFGVITAVIVGFFVCFFCIFCIKSLSANRYQVGSEYHTDHETTETITTTMHGTAWNMKGASGTKRATDCNHGQLPAHLQQACNTLGFTAHIWDNDQDSSYSNHSFNDLPPQQKQAAMALGYTASLWDGDGKPNPVNFSQPAIMAISNPIVASPVYQQAQPAMAQPVMAMPQAAEPAMAPPGYAAPAPAYAAAPPGYAAPAAAPPGYAAPAMAPPGYAAAVPVGHPGPGPGSVLNVTIPAGVLPGQQLQVSPPGGQPLMVTVPAGCVPGQTIAVTIP